jgi:hypothetical protein
MVSVMILFIIFHPRFLKPSADRSKAWPKGLRATNKSSPSLVSYRVVSSPGEGPILRLMYPDIELDSTSMIWTTKLHSLYFFNAFERHLFARLGR